MSEIHLRTEQTTNKYGCIYPRIASVFIDLFQERIALSKELSTHPAMEKAGDGYFLTIAPKRRGELSRLDSLLVRQGLDAGRKVTGQAFGFVVPLQTGCL